MKLIGISNNVKANIFKIKVWADSFRSVCNGEVCLLMANPTEDDFKSISDLNIECIPVKVEGGSVNDVRLGLIRDYLKTQRDDLYLITDVFDVLFQGDPFFKWDLRYDIFAGSECLMLSQEPWNRDVITKCFDFPNDAEIICSGVIGGKRNALIDLYTKMDDMCKNARKNHDIRDQAAFIILIAQGKVPNIKIFDLNDGWTAHCAVSGPTQYFESWGFKNSLRGFAVPQLRNGKITNGKVFDIVHQFNRIPEWYEALTKKYRDE